MLGRVLRGVLRGILGGTIQKVLVGMGSLWGSALVFVEVIPQEFTTFGAKALVRGACFLKASLMSKY